MKKGRPRLPEVDGMMICNKCGEVYEDPVEGFYFETRHGNWRRPCKQCIREYNKEPEQRKRRLEYNRKWKKRRNGNI